MQFLVPFDPDSPWGAKMGFGSRFCVESVKMPILYLKKIWFVSNTSTPHSRSTWKWVPRANFDEKCPKPPKNRLFWKSLRNSQSDLWSWNLAKTALWGLKKLKNRIFVIFGFFDPPGPTLEKFVAENFGKNQKWQFFKIVSFVFSQNFRHQIFQALCLVGAQTKNDKNSNFWLL